MKRKLLMVNHSQFGYHTIYVHYARYLKTDFDITFLCWDYRLKLIEEPGITIQYVSRKGNKIARNVRFIKTISSLLSTSSYHCVFIKYFFGCFVIPFIFNKKQFIHLDIRTGSVIANSFGRKLSNFILRIESRFFNSISIISTGLRTYLKVRGDAYILPVGANSIPVVRYVKNKIELLYVGTFANRNIEDTVEGLGLFLHKNFDANISYTIIGDGSVSELESIKKNIRKYSLDKYVSLMGYVPHSELVSYYEKSSVGVSYVPITPYFNYQPSTKTFEYLMAGMPVIATSTYEHRQIINDVNGIIIDDTPESFANAITQLHEGFTGYKEQKIRSSVAEYEWTKIVTGMKNSILDFV